MLKLDIQSGFKAERCRSGDSSKGPWELIVVRESGRAKKEITIWVNNKPSGISEGDMFRITNITSVKYGARRDQNNNWRDDVSIEADIESMSYTNIGDGFDDLPFNMDGDPFANSNPFADDSDPFAVDDNRLPL